MASSLSPEHRARLAEIVGRMESAGESPENIQTAVEGYKAKYSTSSTSTPELRQTPSLAQRIFNRGAAAAPAIGGFAGGLAGGAVGGPWGAIMGAGAGGTIGKAAQSAYSGEPFNESNLGGAAAEQIVAEALGQGIAAGVGKAARPLMRSAMGIGKAVGGEVKLGSSLFPDPVPVALSRKVSQDAAGALKSTALRRDAGKEIGSKIQAETAAGRTFNTDDVLKYAKEMLNDKSLTTEQRSDILEKLLSFERDKGATMSPELVQAVKRRYGGIYKGWDSGKDPLTGPVAGEFAGKVSEGAREAINSIGGMAAKNAEYESLKGLEKATYAAARRKGPAWELGRVGTYPILRSAIGNRGVNSKIAIKMADPAVQKALQQTPRAILELIDQLMYTDQPDATSAR